MSRALDLLRNRFILRAVCAKASPAKQARPFSPEELTLESQKGQYERFRGKSRQPARPERAPRFTLHTQGKSGRVEWVRTNLIPKNKTGFTLIEITVALLIGSLLSVSLYQVFQNIQKSVMRMNSVIDLDSPVIAFYNQLEQDSLGIFTPRNKPEEKKQQALGAPGAPGVQGAQQAKPEKQEKKIENIFVSNNKSGQVSFNFITTGGFKLIDSNGNYIPASYNKRVLYSLEPDKIRQNLFVLMYGQAESLESGELKNIQKYELARNIKRFDIEYKVFEPKKDKKDSKEKAQKPKLVTVTQFEPKEIYEKYQTYIPAYIEIKGSFIDMRTNLEVPFKYIFQVPAYNIPEAKGAEQPQAGTAPATQAQLAGPAAPPQPQASPGAPGALAPQMGPSGNQPGSLAGFMP